MKAVSEICDDPPVPNNTRSFRTHDLLSHGKVYKERVAILHRLQDILACQRVTLVKRRMQV